MYTYLWWFDSTVNTARAQGLNHT